MDIKYPVSCPLMGNKMIDMGTCFDIHMVIDGGAPKYTAPDDIYQMADYEHICKACKYHRDD